MNLPNYYHILKIEKSEDLNTIKKAFRTEIALYHPDKNKSEDSKPHFNLLVEAFNVLSNSKKREIYDEMLNSSEINKLEIIEPKAERQYNEWKKESKKKAKTYRDYSLTELLLLDIFLDAGFSGLFSVGGDLLEGLGDSLGDVFDIF
ncbi:J domain-containing protein [Psychroserpens luteus]|uniref:DnaJ domain-containing protein n=1 Tax=Psychroserpens luteus TaxID=1434066 RepID=A0ABW5ZVF0_9FLAO|nr:DnaJ domain-containing protein [Psychroserpens luteus]